jgi:3-hexulose-6-phosphate synthase
VVVIEQLTPRIDVAPDRKAKAVKFMTHFGSASIARIKIQVALDTTDLRLALNVAEEVVDLVDRIEVGTPLLRRYGMQAIKALRERLGDVMLVADCKIVDCGAIEVELAVDAGANAVTVQATSSRQTLEAVCSAAQRSGTYVMADTLGAASPHVLGSRLQGLELSHIVVHKGVDEQFISGPIRRSEVIQVAADAQVAPLAIAGGITPSNVSALLGIPNVDTLIVGQSIMASPAPRSAISRLRSAILEAGGDRELRHSLTTGGIRYSNGMQRT